HAAFAPHDSHALDISPDGTVLISAEGARLNMIDLSDGTSWRLFHELDTPGAHEGWIAVVQFHPNGTLLVSASAVDRKVKLWETATGRVLARLAVGGTGPIRAAFSPDGDSLVIAGDDRVVRYELGGLREQILMGPQKARLFATGFTADGRS